jgi:hypothetical protein
VISVANLGSLTFTPANGQTGSPYTSFTFQVQDNGGTANGGRDLSLSASTITVNVVTPINHAPSGQNTTITLAEDSAYTFNTSNFGFSDVNDTPANNFLSLRITTLPTSGTLFVGQTSAAMGQVVPVSLIMSGALPMPMASRSLLSRSRFRTTGPHSTAELTSIRRPTRSRSMFSQSMTLPPARIELFCSHPARRQVTFSHSLILGSPT